MIILSWLSAYLYVRQGGHMLDQALEYILDVTVSLRMRTFIEYSQPALEITRCFRGHRK
jgi:hypothetical protein